MTDETSTRADRIPAEALFVGSGISQYLGASLAITLFASVAPLGVAWLRVVGASIALVLWRRPWRTDWTRPALGWAALFGITLAAMNAAFYLAIERLTLGTAVAIEFLGPISVAAWGSRTRRNQLALIVAAAGVLLISNATWDAHAAGVAAALGAAALWAASIPLGARVAKTCGGIDGLAVGLVAGSLALAPICVGPAWPAFSSVALLMSCALVGVLSNAIPYGLDQIVLRRISPARFAFLLAILPATAAAIGFLLLRQIPSPSEAGGMALVAVALVVRARN